VTAKLSFDLATVGAFVVPLSLAIILVALSRPKRPLYRSAIAVASAWMVSVVYTIYVYNPAGIAAGHELGWDSPEMRFDNNTVAVQLAMGWLYPTIAVALFFAVRRMRLRRTAAGNP
jgi:hypothetical protein